MNPNRSNRKVFIGPALVVSAIVVVIAIVVISVNLSRVDAPQPKDGINAVRALKPAPLTGAATPPPILQGRIMSGAIAGGAFTTPFFDGGANELTIESLKGTGLVVNFWATWCLPCIKEMPALDRLAGKFIPVRI